MKPRNQMIFKTTSSSYVSMPIKSSPWSFGPDPIRNWASNKGNFKMGRGDGFDHFWGLLLSHCQESLRSSQRNRDESWERWFLLTISLELKVLLDVPVPSSHQPLAYLSALWPASELADTWWKSGHILSSCQTKEGPGEEVWHEPGPCQGRWQLLGSQRRNLCPCSLGTDTISGRRERRGEQGRKGKSQGFWSGGNIHSGGRTVCQEENSGTKRAKHVCTRIWGSNIQTELCLFSRTHVKGLFVLSWNPGVCHKLSQVIFKPLESNLQKKGRQRARVFSSLRRSETFFFWTSLPVSIKESSVSKVPAGGLTEAESWNNLKGAEAEKLPSSSSQPQLVLEGCPWRDSGPPFI